ncbi:alpha-soluble NSF attachment protein-like [Dreissena polymorpha]|uniref:Alpha-soluble NSF attachment protein n=1 Tax=Dreissena polymorpha TaxID=45954 RepID=A0A9D4R8J9_DREPO|nr:alpha-soluble NSF attachment protein-like [Dreissena polymorpha]KAH3859036.1 hypothetical protein DPMN_101682 [Dreissena polymorpha]
MADQEQKAIQFVEEAEKKLKSSKGFFGSMFGGSTKVEDAAELFVRAANAYKMAKKWPGAGESFCRAAELQLQLGSKHEAATHYVDAGSAYKKSDPQEAVNCLGKAIEIYTDMGRFTIAAKHHVSIAEIYENELADMEKAISSYQQAADYYKGEESNASGNKCLLKVAQYAAQLERYDVALQIYEEIAMSCMDNALLKYSAKDHFFRAAVCHLCVDTLNCQQALQRYEELFPQFADARESKLLKSLVQACEDEDADVFTDAIKEYDSISRLDQWTTTMLLRVKKRINQDDLK